MSLGKWLKDKIVESEEQPKPPAATKVSATVSTAAPVFQTSVPAVSDGLYQELLEAVLTKDTGYTRFLKATKALEAVIPDELTRFRAALATVSANGLTADEIVRSLTLHYGALETEKQEVAHEVKTKVQAVQGLQAEVDRIDGDVSRLEGQITELRGRKAALVADIATKSEKISSASQTFEAACTRVLAVLETAKSQLMSAKA